MTLEERAISQGVINSEDWQRVTATMDTASIEVFRSKVAVIDKINDVPVRGLFNPDEDILARAKLQGGISSNDFGRLPPEERQQVLQEVSIIDVPDLNVQAEPMLRSKFETLSNAEKEQVMQKEIPLTDELPQYLGAEELRGVLSNITNTLKAAGKADQGDGAD